MLFGSVATWTDGARSGYLAATANLSESTCPGPLDASHTPPRNTPQPVIPPDPLLGSRYLNILQAKRHLKRDACTDLHRAAGDGSGADRTRALRSARSRQIHRIVEVNIRRIEIRVVEYIAGVCTEL